MARNVRQRPRAIPPIHQQHDSISPTCRIGSRARRSRCSFEEMTSLDGAHHNITLSPLHISPLPHAHLHLHTRPTRTAIRWPRLQSVPWITPRLLPSLLVRARSTTRASRRRQRQAPPHHLAELLRRLSVPLIHRLASDICNNSASNSHNKSG